MLTKDDKKWIDDKFATKEDLRTELRKYATKDDLTVMGARLGLEFDKKIDNLKEDIGTKHDEVLTRLDKIMGGVIKGREHDLVVAHQIERLNKHVFGN